MRTSRHVNRRKQLYNKMQCSSSFNKIWSYFCLLIFLEHAHRRNLRSDHWFRCCFGAKPSYGSPEVSWCKNIFSASFFFNMVPRAFFLPQVIIRVPQVKFVVPRDFFQHSPVNANFLKIAVMYIFCRESKFISTRNIFTQVLI